MELNLILLIVIVFLIFFILKNNLDNLHNNKDQSIYIVDSRPYYPPFWDYYYWFPYNRNYTSYNYRRRRDNYYIRNEKRRIKTNDRNKRREITLKQNNNKQRIKIIPSVSNSRTYSASKQKRRSKNRK